MALDVYAAPSFARVAKKLHLKDKRVLEEAVQAIAASPTLGDEKRADLAGVFVYKLKLNNQELLLAYELRPSKLQPQSLVLLGVGRHENLYRDLKR